MTNKGFLRFIYKRLHRDIKGFNLKITPRNAVGREFPGARVQISSSPPQVHRNFNGITVDFLCVASGFYAVGSRIEKDQKCAIMYTTDRHYGEQVL